MKTIRVATHNICHTGWNPLDHTELFPDHSYRNGYPEEISGLMKENWKNVYSGFSADLIGLQEYCEWFDLGHTKTTAETVFRPFGYEIVHPGRGLAVATRFALEPVYESDFQPVSNRRRQKFYAEIDGKRVAILNSHPTPRLDGGDVRQAEYRILMEDFAKETYFIAFGDYNARTAEEFRIFEEAGYPMANRGIGTVRKSGCTCDNIIVSPNIRILKTELFDPDYLLSDHQVLYAEIEIP